MSAQTMLRASPGSDMNRGFLVFAGPGRPEASVEPVPSLRWNGRAHRAANAGAATARRRGRPLAEAPPIYIWATRSRPNEEPAAGATWGEEGAEIIPMEGGRSSP